MMSKLFSLVLFFSFTLSFSQTQVVNLQSTDNVPNIVFNTLDANSNSADTIVFNFNTGVYNVTTINVAGSSSSTPPAKIIFKSNDNNKDSVTISSGGNSVFNIMSSNVSLQDITVESVDNGYYQTVTYIDGSYQTYQTDSLSFTNCKFIAGSAGDCFGKTTSYSYNNFSFNNCEFINGITAIDFSYVTNLRITNSTFFNQTAKNLNLNDITNLKVENNLINLPVGSLFNEDFAYGLYLNYVYADMYYSDGITSISNNKILGNTNHLAYKAIYMENCYNYGAKFIVSNNIFDIQNDSLIYGIELMDATSQPKNINSDKSTKAVENINFINNSFNLMSSDSAICLSASVSSGYMPQPFNNTFKNNIIKTNGTAVYTNYSPYFSEFNNNNYLTTNATPFTNPNDGVTAINFNLWQQLTGFDFHSTNIDPMFSGNFGDLTPHNPLLSNTVPRLADANRDINGTYRCAPLCDVGAIEVAYVNLVSDTVMCYNSGISLNAGNNYYSYLWSTNENAQIINATTAGSYSVTIQEVPDGAIASASVNVAELPEIIIELQSLEPLCYNTPNGYVVANITNGNANLTYNWAGNYQGDGTASLYNIGLGTYYLTVTDVLHQCEVESQIFVNAPYPLVLSFDTIAFCGGCIGEISSNAMGGTAPYSYNWNNGSNLNQITDLCQGEYILTITDANGCLYSDSIEIHEGPLGYLAGTIQYSGGFFNENDVKVELFKQYNENAFHIEKLDETLVNNQSKFEFTGVYPNAYTFRANVEQGTYNNVVASYYKTTNTTTNWYEASYVNIGCGDTITDITFTMHEVENLAGYGYFSGTVFYSNDAKSNGEPVTGAEIYIEQEPNDEPLANTSTNQDGEWTVSNIPTGTGYHIIVDIPGLDQISTYEDLYITPNDTAQNNLNFVVDTTSGGGIYIDTITSVISLNNQSLQIKVYPNPTNNFVNFETTINEQSNINFEIVDIKGATVYSSEKSNNFVGKYNETIDLTNYTAGTYLIKFKINNNYFLKKIIKN